MPIKYKNKNRNFLDIKVRYLEKIFPRFAIIFRFDVYENIRKYFFSKGQIFVLEMIQYLIME